MGASHSFPRTQLSKDKIVIVTGGNTGIGYDTAKWIAMLGANVIIACRSEQRANDAIKRMNEEFKEEKKKTSTLTDADNLAVEFMKVDLASLKSVMSFIEDFKASGRKLHSLVCNAGIGPYEQTITEDGNEMIFQVNYLSQFLITAHFLPIMNKSGSDCRIVLVSSSAHTGAGFNVQKLQGKQYSKRAFSGIEYYGRSKLYQVMQMYSMNRRINQSNVTVTSLHPGLVATEFGRAFEHGCCLYCLWLCFTNCGCAKSSFNGAETSINAVVNPEYVDKRDLYFADCKVTSPSNVARNETYQEQLWEITLELLMDYLTDEIKDYLEGRRTSLQTCKNSI